MNSFVIKHTHRHLLDKREVDEAELSFHCAYLIAAVPKLVTKVGDLLELEDLLLQGECLLLSQRRWFSIIRCMKRMLTFDHVEILASLELKELA